MKNDANKQLFWIGNGILLAALLVMLSDTLWQKLGSWNMALWMILAAIGVYLITRDKGPGNNIPD
jgi:cell division protein FtsW (lipid II flippase)